MAGKKKSKKTKRRKARRNLGCFTAVLLIMVVIGVAVTLSLTVFFKIETVKVSGSATYSSKQISDVCGINAGDNLILLKKDNVINNINKNLPLTGDITVKKQFPSTVVISVKDAKPDSCYSAGKKYVCTYKNRVIKAENERPKGVLMIKCKVVRYTIGDMIETKDGNIELVQTLKQKAQENSVSEITCIDVNDETDIKIYINSAIELRLGTTDNLDYKLQTAKKVIEQCKEKYGDKVEGSLNLKYLNPNEGKKNSYFTRESIKE